MFTIFDFGASAALNQPEPCRPDDFPPYDEQVARSIHDEECTFLATYATSAVAQEHGTLAPWVRRNLDCAQYAHPRGSLYEG